MQTKLATAKANIRLLETTFPGLDFTGLEHVAMVYVDPSARIKFDFDYCPNEDGRQRLLHFAAEAFGREDWIKKPNYGRTHYDWKKSINGIEITLESAEKLPDLVVLPVSPREFPIMLTDREEEA